MRHNLSLNKAFVKEERPKDEPGKGHYWKIVSGAESQFAKGAKGRRPLNHHRPSSGGMTPISTQVQLARTTALSHHSSGGIDDAPTASSKEAIGRTRAESTSSIDGTKPRKSSQPSKFPIFGFEMSGNFKSPTAARLQGSPVLPPSMDTPPPSQEPKANRKRKSFRDRGYLGTQDNFELFFTLHL